MATQKQLNGPLGPTYDASGQQPVSGYRGALVAGTGIKTGAGTIYKSAVFNDGNVIKTEIFIDLTGLNSSTAGDIIGKDGGTANCHLGLVTTALCGNLFAGRISCIEAPATGEPDIDVMSSSVGTGAEDAAGSGLAGYVLHQDHAADYTAAGHYGVFATVPAADRYIYLLGSGGGDAATYTAGQFLIELWGYPV